MIDPIKIPKFCHRSFAGAKPWKRFPVNANKYKQETAELIRVESIAQEACVTSKHDDLQESPARPTPPAILIILVDPT